MTLRRPALARVARSARKVLSSCAPTVVSMLALAAMSTSTREARADDAKPTDAKPADAKPAGEAAGTVTVAPDATIDLTKDTKTQADDPNAPPPEAPPPLPYKKTFVLDSSLGAMAFFGDFGKVAPPGFRLRTQLGYELFKWFMVFGEGDLAFTDTSNREAPPRTRAFPIFGFGGGARFTVRFTDRFGIYAQGSIGAMKADVATNSLGLLGFRNAESLGLYFAGRLGVEWYQIDRHLGLGLTFGIRSAQGFEKVGAGGSAPLAGDAGVALRYAF